MHNRTLILTTLCHLTLLPTCLAQLQDKDRSAPTPHELIKAGKPEEAIELMKQDRKWIYRSDQNQCTPLHVAARMNQLKTVQWLLDNDADVYARAYNQLTALDFAREPEIAALILKAKPELEPDRARWHSKTPLQGAAENYADENDAKAKEKWLKITRLIRDAGAVYDLQSAIYLDDLDEVRKVIAVDPELIHQHRPDLPLRIAAAYGRLEICQELLKIEDVDVNDVEHGSGYPIIYEALAHPKVVKLLIDRGADLESRITYRGGRTGIWIVHDDAPLLHHAADESVPETVKLLLDHGADPFIEIFDTFSDSKRPQTALDVAAIFGKVDNLLEIVRHSTFADAPKEKRQPLIDRCLVHGTVAFQDEPVDHVQLYKGLLAAGANPNAVYDERTAIQEAAANFDLEVSKEEDPDDRTKARNESLRNGIKLLREAGAKLDLFTAVSLKDEEAVREILKVNPKEASLIGPDGIPAIHMAIKWNDAKILSLILAAGCDVNLRTKSQNYGGLETTPETPLDWAQIRGSEEILEILNKYHAATSSELDNKQP